MNFSLLADIESAFESFFSSLTSSTTFNILFILGICLELFFILLFAIKSRFSYEARMRRSLDTLNKWLFKYKTLDKENIKEFNNLIKKAPKRLALNWQQYILYREKAPSQYMSVENIIEKPLRASSYSLNIKNLVWISGILMLVSFILGISYNNITDTILNATMLITALIVPLFIFIMCAIAVVILSARKNANLDELYQNLHLFDRFVDNACIGLPSYIDYSLLFTNEEIDKGIPALREYLESRARKEKEEFDKITEEQNVVYEKFDFSKLGINGQNILERAMKETEAYLSKRDKTLAKITQIEATLETLKRNFENIQKDYQKKMQITKENIESLRQQQEETTSRIESNYLRKQQGQEIAKQEKDENEFEQQKRRYLVEKGEYEETIKTLQEELEAGKGAVEEAMMSEYESFYTQLFKSAHLNAEKKVKENVAELKAANVRIEKDLTLKEAQLKRVIDENESLKSKLGIEYKPIEIDSIDKLEEQQIKQQEIEKKEEDAIQTPEELSDLIKQHTKEVRAQLDKFNGKLSADNMNSQDQESVQNYDSDEDFDFVEPSDKTDNSAFAEQVPPQKENNAVDYSQYSSEYIPDEEEYTPFDVDVQDEENIAPNSYQDSGEENEATTTTAIKRRGRPKKGEERKLEEIVAEKRPRGRPKKSEIETKTKAKRGRPAGSIKTKASTSEKATTTQKRGRPKKVEVETTVKSKRGRPSGTTKNKQNVISEGASKGRGRPKKVETIRANAEKVSVKKGRGRPKKTESANLKTINKRIEDEENKLSAKKSELDKEIKKAINDLEKGSNEQARRDELLAEISDIKKSVESARQNLKSADNIEALNKRIEALLDEIKNLNG